MGQKTNPIGNRLGIIKGWESNWFGGRDMAAKVVEDEQIRQYLRARIQKGGIARIIIERTLKRVTVSIQTSRPGIIIGKGGQEVDRIREELKKLTSKDVQININEIRKPEMDAVIVGETVAKQIEGRINHRRAIKMAIQQTIRVGAEGIKIRISGRVGGSDMARTEEYKEGRTPLHTFRADIDYANVEAQTVYGKIGIKVWICKGEVFGKRDLSPFQEDTKSAGNQGGNRGGNDRGGNDRGDRRDGGRGGDRRGGDNRGGGGGNRGGGQGGDNRGGGGQGGNNRGGGGQGGNNRGGGGGQGGGGNRGGGAGGQGGGGNRGGGSGGPKR
jgi:small subunit ribosomal protein S3